MFSNRRILSAAGLALLLLAASSCATREERVAAERDRCGDIIGFWRVTYDGPGRSPSSLKWIDVDDDGDLITRLHVELKWNIFMQTDDDEISWEHDSIAFWDEFTGRMLDDRETIRLTYTGFNGKQHPFVMNRLRDADTIRLLRDVYASRSAGADLLPVPDLRDGLRVGSFHACGIDSLPFAALVQEIHAGDYGDIHCLLMSVDDTLFLEEYFGAGGQLHGPAVASFLRRTHHQVQSVSKSMLSAVTGVACDSGLLPPVSTPVAELLPEYASLLAEKKRDITLHHLLAMNTGLTWNESGVSLGDSTNDIHRMHTRRDPSAYVLSRPLRTLPGRAFVYNSGCYHLVQEIIDRHVGTTTGELAFRALFAPMGCDSLPWEKGGAPHIRARDLWRLGSLVLHDGAWQGRQLISRDWVARSTANQQHPDQTAYGYFWWPQRYHVQGDTMHAVAAIGSGGQYLLLFPELDFIALVLAGNYEEHYGTRLREVMETVVLPAVRGRGAAQLAGK